MPLKAQRKWYSKLPYGYARGWEPVLYVNNIRAYYNILVWLTEQEETEQAEDELDDEFGDDSGDDPMAVKNAWS